jgi:DNA (cytosine-5)-methyltransferase 1
MTSEPYESGSLFSGTAALDMAAAEVLGCTPAWFCDPDPGAAALLSHHFGDVPNLGDITKVDFAAVPPVQVLTGGFPCQDISHAGKRAGIEGARSGLWTYYVEAIRVLRPRYVLIENVGALVVRGLDRVLADLAALGFDAEWTAVRASEVGAPHKRERIFIAAAAQNSDGTAGGEWRLAAPGQAEGGWARANARGRGRAPSADTGGGPIGEQPVAEPRRCGTAIAGLDHAASPDAPSDGRNEGGAESARLLGGPDASQCGASLANTDVDGPQGSEPAGGQDVLAWGDYEPAIRRWEAILGRPAPAPTVVGARGGRVLSPDFVEFLMGLPAGHVTEVPGLSRNTMLKLLGNGVVPQQAVAAFEHLLGLLAEQPAVAA